MSDADRALAQLDRLGELVGNLREDLARTQESQLTFYEREWPRAAAVLDGLETRLARVERALEAHQAELRALVDRIGAGLGALSQQARELDAGGRQHELRTAALERRNAEVDAGDKRQRRLFAAAMTLVSTLAGVATWLVGQFFSK
jgi:chromosome segregation ATPase